MVPKNLRCSQIAGNNSTGGARTDSSNEAIVGLQRWQQDKTIGSAYRIYENIINCLTSANPVLQY